MLLKQLNLLGLVTLLLFCTCKKKSGTIPIDSAVKEFYSFAPGTYWIYYDSLTGQTDSFLVSQDDTRVTSSSHEAIETIVIMIYKNGVPDSVYISWNLIGWKPSKQLAESNVDFAVRIIDRWVDQEGIAFLGLKDVAAPKVAMNQRSGKTVLWKPVVEMGE